jgi:hypothetical protein
MMYGTPQFLEKNHEFAQKPLILNQKQALNHALQSEKAELWMQKAVPPSFYA